MEIDKIKRVGKPLRGLWSILVDVSGVIPILKHYLIRRIEARQNRLIPSEKEQKRRIEKTVESIANQTSRHSVAKIVANLCTPQSRILEFGAGYGHNIEILSKLIEARFIAVEPGSAIDSLPQRVSGAEVLRDTDDTFLQTEIGSVDVSFTRGVLILLGANRAKALVKRLCELSRYIVIAELLTNMNRNTSTVMRGRYIAHPYKRWLDSFGFEIREVIRVDGGEQIFQSILVAQSQDTSGSATAPISASAG